MTACTLSLLSASLSKAFFPYHVPHSIVIQVFLSDFSPPPYILIFSLVTFSSCQLPSPCFPSLLQHCSPSHTFSVCTFSSPACKACSCSSFVSHSSSILCFVCFCILSLLCIYFIFLRDLTTFLPFTSSVSPLSHRPSPHPTHSSFSPTSSIFSPSPSQSIFIPAMSE